MKYIDAAKAADKIKEAFNISMCDLVDVFVEIPAEDVQPVRFARWIDLDNRILCSGCGAGYDDYDEVKQNTYIFCPNCGARMDGDAE